MENNTITQMPRIGDTAPDFTVTTTTGPLPFLNITKEVGLLCFLTLPILRQFVPQK
jgi:hypothetical protein